MCASGKLKIVENVDNFTDWALRKMTLWAEGFVQLCPKKALALAWWWNRDNLSPILDSLMGKEDPWEWVRIEENQLGPHIKDMKIWVKIFKREVQWETEKGALLQEGACSGLREVRKAKTVDCIIAGIWSIGQCSCPICECQCKACWKETQWENLILLPEETVHTYLWYFVENGESQGTGMEELEMIMGITLDGVLAKSELNR